MPGARSLTIATVNVNGLRAAHTNGMSGWWAARQPDIVTLQEVRAPDELVAPLIGEISGSQKGWHVVHHESQHKGRAGVAVVTATKKAPIVASRSILKGNFDATGRWIEADIDTADGRGLTVVSTYVHTGDADDEARMAEKLGFLDAARRRMAALAKAGRHVVVTGDFNVGHRELDIKNWKGNRGKAGFLPEERSFFDRLLDDGWVDVQRSIVGNVEGPYSWWSWRGKAFDVDTGWRIDYHLATPELAATATDAVVDRAASYAERWSDHAPVVVTYRV